MAKYNGIITAFETGAKLLKRVGWTTGEEISLKDDQITNELSEAGLDPLYHAKNKHIRAMCAIGAMKRGLYFEYKEQYKEKTGSLKGWDDQETIMHVESICNDAEEEFWRFLSKKKNRKELEVDEAWWENQAENKISIIEHFNDGEDGGDGVKKVMRTMLAAAEARYERLKKKRDEKKR